MVVGDSLLDSGRPKVEDVWWKVVGGWWRWGNLRSGERDRQGDGLTAGAGLVEIR